MREVHCLGSRNKNSGGDLTSLSRDVPQGCDTKLLFVKAVLGHFMSVVLGKNQATGH